MSWLSAAADIDLIAHGTTSDADTIRDTAVAQPLIVASGLVATLALFDDTAAGRRAVTATAGHSVGEITAAAGAGMITAEQAMVLVRERGRAMAAASAVQPTGMSAVVGGDPDEVAAALAAQGLTAANNNGAGQIVAAGTLEQLAALAAAPPAKARVIPLQVAGAFHTDHMRPAVSLLEGYARAITTRGASTPVLSNRDGQVVCDGADFLRRLVDQVARPVRWDLVMDAFQEMGVTGLIEIPPAGTLTNLAKRGLKGVETLALKTPDDLDKARAIIAEHGLVSDIAVDETAWRLLVAPAKGTVSRADLDADVAAGSQVATVSTQDRTVPVVAPSAGSIIEWLVADGEPVAPGQPIVRLHPAGVA